MQDLLSILFANPWIVLPFLIFVGFLLIIFVSGLRVLKEWERAPVLRLGRYHSLKGPGVIWIMPFFDKIPRILSLRLQTFGFRSESTLTKDNVPTTVDAVLYFRVVDPEKAVLEVEQYATATQWAAQTTLREVIGQNELDQLLSERHTIGQHCQEIIDEKTEHWGIKVTSVEIRDVVIPGSLQEAISRQAEAERERRARITLAQAEKEAAKGMIEAANIYYGNPIAMELRWINLLFEAAGQPAATMVFMPVNMPVTGFGTLGIQGIVPMARVTKKKETFKE
ncbi:MAG: SPFH domain-containing protein [Candidatus Hermodarchaeota archaeon]